MSARAVPRCFASMFVLLAASAVSCSVSDGVLGRLLPSHGSADGGAASAGCALTSPVVTLQGYSTCAGRLAASHFSNALCVCNNLHLADYLTTRGFDSSQGPYQTGRSDDSGAAVGVNGAYTSLAGATDIAGSFSVAGKSAALQFVGSLLVRGDFRVAGNVLVAGNTTVKRDAWLAGNFVGLGLEVDGNLHHAGTVLVALPLSAVTNQQETVSIARPCPCDIGDLLDIDGLVDAAKLDNDNQSLGIVPDVLAAVAGPREWTLPCGRIYLSEIVGTGDVVVHVGGNTALFVDGSINLKGSLSFQRSPGAKLAELDVFVRHDLAVQGPLSLTDRERPAAGRMSVGGTQTISLASPLTGNLYAPRAQVTATAGLEVWGAIFAGDLVGGAYATFIFDRDIVEVGTNCTAPRPPAGVCTQCEWCYGGAACVDGLCGPCQADSDCCGQSVCSNGRCVLLLDVGE